jgi:hypothetical protein
VQRDWGIYYCPSCKYLYKPPGLKGVLIAPFSTSLSPSIDTTFPFEILTPWTVHFDSSAAPLEASSPAILPSMTPSTTTETPPGTQREPKGTTETLTPNDWKLIRAMKDVGAVDSEQAASRDKITKRARNGNADSKHNQESFDRLKRLALVDSVRRVGTWLTAKGLAAVESENR